MWLLLPFPLPWDSSEAGRGILSLLEGRQRREDTGGWLCCQCPTLFAFFPAHPVIENGQVECPQGYKRLNRSHCQGKDAAFVSLLLTSTVRAEIIYTKYIYLNPWYSSAKNVIYKNLHVLIKNERKTGNTGLHDSADKHTEHIVGPVQENSRVKSY